MTALRIEALSKSFGGFRAVSNVSLSVDTGQIAAVIGPNGAGKSTLFNLITGHLEPDGGTIPMKFTAHLSAPSFKPVTVHYATVNGTAQAFTDYRPASGTISFAPGRTFPDISSDSTMRR